MTIHHKVMKNFYKLQHSLTSLAQSEMPRENHPKKELGTGSSRRQLGRWTLTTFERDSMISSSEFRIRGKCRKEQKSKVVTFYFGRNQIKLFQELKLLNQKNCQELKNNWGPKTAFLCALQGVLGYFLGNSFYKELTKLYPKSNFSLKLGHLGNFLKRFTYFTIIKFKQFLKKRSRNQMGTEKPCQELTQNKKPSGTKSTTKTQARN